MKSARICFLLHARQSHRLRGMSSASLLHLTVPVCHVITARRCRRSKAIALDPLPLHDVASRLQSSSRPRKFKEKPFTYIFDWGLRRIRVGSLCLRFWVEPRISLYAKSRIGRRLPARLKIALIYTM